MSGEEKVSQLGQIQNNFIFIVDFLLIPLPKTSEFEMVTVSHAV